MMSSMSDTSDTTHAPTLTLDEISQYLAEKGAETEAVMARYLDELEAGPPALLAAIRYSLLGGGKRLRPALGLAAAQVVGGTEAAAMPAACAIEMIHCYSLIHDDLPAMDNDDLRRGKPTCHRAFGEATAILGGDALLTMAFDMAAQSGSIEIIREIAHAAGITGMAGGQQLDIESEGKEISVEDLQRIHACKTGALIRCCLRCGGILGGASPAALAALTVYGEHLGLAFQITDDILNVTGNEAALGKPVGSDANKLKSTYPALVGLERAQEMADAAAAGAIEAVAQFGPRAALLRGMARFVASRDK